MTDVFAAALADIFASEIGSDAVFSPASGSDVPCRVIVNRDILMQPESMTAQVYERGISIESLLSEIGRAPVRGERFTVTTETFGVETFTVQSLVRNDGLTAEAIVT